MKPGSQKTAKADDSHRSSEGQAGDNKNEGKAEHNTPRFVDLNVRPVASGTQGDGRFRRPSARDTEEA